MPEPDSFVEVGNWILKVFLEEGYDVIAEGFRMEGYFKEGNPVNPEIAKRFFKIDPKWKVNETFANENRDCRTKKLSDRVTEFKNRGTKRMMNITNIPYSIISTYSNSKDPKKIKAFVRMIEERANVQEIPYCFLLREIATHESRAFTNHPYLLCSSTFHDVHNHFAKQAALRGKSTVTHWDEEQGTVRVKIRTAGFSTRNLVFWIYLLSMSQENTLDG